MTYRAWPKGRIITFCRPAAELGALSNFSRLPVIINGLTVPTSEALYQAMKFPHRPDVQRAICDMSSPAAAKRLARHYAALTHPNWPGVRVTVMGWVVRVKFLQHHTRLVTALAATGDRPIVEYSARDRFWGAGPHDHDRRALYGLNMLGRLWTRVRDLHTTAPAGLLCVEPLPLDHYGFPLTTPGEGAASLSLSPLIGFNFLGRPIRPLK
jgi:ribA/ribD-fused uncharacterized protein